MKKNNDFSLLVLTTIPMAVALNIVGFSIVKMMNIPIFLDFVGTTFISLLAGPLVGVVTSIISSLILGSMSSEFLTFAPVGIAMAFCLGLLAKLKITNIVYKIIFTVIILYSISVIVSAPIIVYAYGGSTGNASAGVTAFFIASGQELWSAVMSSTMITELADKMITGILANLIIYTMPVRYLIKYKYGENNIMNRK